MTPRQSGSGPASAPIAFLQWSLGIVVLIASLRTLFHSFHELIAARAPGHLWFLPVLAPAEILGAILFLVPGTMRIGSYLLLVVFTVAALFHLLHGDWEIGSLIIYIAAVVVVRSSTGGF